MFTMLFPRLYWLLVLDTMGLSSITGTWPKPTSQSDKDD